METELYHYGVKGMKWGVRKARPAPTGMRPRGRGQVGGTAGRPGQQTAQSSAQSAQAQAAKKARRRKALKIGAAVAATALAAYGAKKLYDVQKEKKRMSAARAAIDKMEWHYKQLDESGNVVKRIDRYGMQAYEQLVREGRQSRIKGF